MLIWRHICFAMTSLIAQCIFKIINVSQQRCPCICFDEVTIIAIYIRFNTVAFWSFNFLWLLDFSDLYLVSLDNFKRRINDENLALIDRTTEKPKEKQFTKKNNHFINKSEKLKNSSRKKSKQKTISYIKQAVINLTDTELTEEQMSLLSLGPNFVRATKRIQFLDIISATEACAIDLENSSKETDAELLCQK